MPEVVKVNEFSAMQAQDFYTRVRGKIATWAQGAGAGTLGHGASAGT